MRTHHSKRGIDYLLLEGSRSLGGQWVAEALRIQPTLALLTQRVLDA